MSTKTTWTEFDHTAEPDALYGRGYDAKTRLEKLREALETVEAHEDYARAKLEEIEEHKALLEDLVEDLEEEVEG